MNKVGFLGWLTGLNVAIFINRGVSPGFWICQLTCLLLCHLFLKWLKK